MDKHQLGPIPSRQPLSRLLLPAPNLRIKTPLWSSGKDSCQLAITPQARVRFPVKKLTFFNLLFFLLQHFYVLLINIWQRKISYLSNQKRVPILYHHFIRSCTVQYKYIFLYPPMSLWGGCAILLPR